MSLFKKPKKIASRRVFSIDTENEKMDIEESNEISIREETKEKKKDKKDKLNLKPQKSSLLSFGDEGKLTFPDILILLDLVSLIDIFCSINLLILFFTFFLEISYNN
jgi:hypothetical protein